MIRINLNLVFLVFLLLFNLTNCDSQKQDKFNLTPEQFTCYVLADCSSGRGVKFGMVGDSWTDLLYGTNFIETLRIQLEKYHNYKIVGATKGGETIQGVMALNSHLKVIDEAGPNLKYMLISLGGNDVQGNPGAYSTNGFITEKNTRFTTYKNNLKQMILTGNTYKVSKYGGTPLIWIIHGYDFASPDNEKVPSSTTTCRTTLKAAGWSDAQIDGTDTQFNLPTTFNQFNDLLRNLTSEEPYLRYIDLRYTLGASSSNKFQSNPNLYFDCIHPNDVGFRILGEKYAKAVEGLTNNER